ncbi:MAG TPA: class I SAM-dependent methyltransferase [Candidatus Paceibacterota bacterium]
MPKLKKMLEQNKRYYKKLYAKGASFLQYPADWIIRFHNLYLKKHLPKGKVLDYGCGTANNSIFFIEKGYDVWGVEVSENSFPLIKKNLERNHFDPKQWMKRFSLISPDATKIPFKSGFFDLIVSNQVLYYLSSGAQIRKVCKEISRCLKPGGLVFLTMMGPGNYYIKYHTKQIYPGGIYEIFIGDPKHYLYGNRELIYVVKDEEHLKDLFSEFECLSMGYFDVSMFDQKGGQHWIFIGRKRSR